MMGDLSITADDLDAMYPCGYWSGECNREILGGKRWTALEILALDDVPVTDRLWLVLRPELIPARMLHELACRFTEGVLPAWEWQHPGNRRPHKAIATKRAWLRGEITDKQLKAARNFGWPVARLWPRHAAWGAALDAARDLASAARWDAAWAAAAAVVWDRQIEITHEVLESEVTVGPSSN